MLRLLPIEVLETITSYVTAGEVAKLLRSGDVVLKNKLRNGAVRSLHFEWLESSPMPWISSLLATFPQLEVCSITTSLPYMDCPSMELATLPTNLRSLSLQTDYLWAHLEAQNICFSILLPSLTSLELSDVSSPTTRILKAYLEGLLGSLPPGLVRLKVWLPTLLPFERPTSVFLPLLPPTLLSLDLHLPFVDDDPTALFPPLLESLRLRGAFLFPGLSIFSKLPSTLLEFHFIGFSLENGRILFYPSDIPLLPPLLTHFRASLPRSPPTWNDEHAQLLPRQLKEFYGAVSSSVDSVWTEECLPHLPRGLENMNAILIRSPSHNLDQFVPNMKKLTIRGDWANKEVSGLVFPSRLVELDLPLISDEICLLLPKTLQKLKAHMGVLGEVGAAALSKGLKELKIPAIAFSKDEVLHHLGHVTFMHWMGQGDGKLNLTANCLQHVTVVGKGGWTRFEIELGVDLAWPSVAPFGADLLRLVNLERFCFTFRDIARDSGPRLSDFILPKTLRHLSLNRLALLPSPQELLRLPPKLQYLLLRWNPTHQCDWTNETFKTLPRTLRTLYLQNLPTRDDIQPHLPPYLFDCDPWPR